MKRGEGSGQGLTHCPPDAKAHVAQREAWSGYLLRGLLQARPLGRRLRALVEAPVKVAGGAPAGGPADARAALPQPLRQERRQRAQPRLQRLSGTMGTSCTLRLSRLCCAGACMFLCADNLASQLITMVVLGDTACLDAAVTGRIGRCAPDERCRAPSQSAMTALPCYVHRSMHRMHTCRTSGVKVGFSSFPLFMGCTTGCSATGASSRLAYRHRPRCAALHSGSLTKGMTRSSTVANGVCYALYSMETVMT